MELFSAYADSDEDTEKKEEVQEKPQQTAGFSLVQYDNEDAEDDTKEDDNSTAKVHIHVNPTTPPNLKAVDAPSPRIETVIDVDIQAPEPKPMPIETPPAFVSLLGPEVPSLEDMLPPKPIDEPNPKLTEKLSRFHQLREQGKSINQNLVNSHAFKNPDILEKLVQYMGITEISSNYPKEVFDPNNIQESDYYDNLAKAQNAFYDRDQKPAENATPAPVASQTNNTAANKGGKSKWDVVEEERKEAPQQVRQEVQKKEDEPGSAYEAYIREKKKQAEMQKLKEGALNKKPRKS